MQPSSLSRSPLRRSAAPLLLGLVGLGLALTFSLAGKPGAFPSPGPARGGAYRVQATDERPPADPRYEAAVRRGLRGELAGGRRDLLQLVEATRGTSTAAWSLYQAGLAAKALQDPAGQREHWERLAREYAGHPLALRVSGSSGAKGPVAKGPVMAAGTASRRADCGPLALARLLRQAGLPVEERRLARECGTDKRGTTLEALLRVAREWGLRAEAAQVDARFLREERPRGMAWVSGAHYVAFEPGPGDRAQVWDPNGGVLRLESWQELAERSQGVVLLVAWGDDRLPKL